MKPTNPITAICYLLGESDERDDSLALCLATPDHLEYNYTIRKGLGGVWDFLAALGDFVMECTWEPEPVYPYDAIERVPVYHLEFSNFHIAGGWMVGINVRASNEVTTLLFAFEVGNGFFPWLAALRAIAGYRAMTRAF